MRNLIVMTLILASTAVAHAEEGPATRYTKRSGWTGGVAVGMGELHMFINDASDQVIEGAAVSLRGGKALHQKTLFMIELNYITDRNGTTSQMIGAYGQFYLTPRWWFRAGGGLTRLVQEPSGGGESTAAPGLPDRLFATVGDEEFSVGGMGGIGVDYFQTYWLALSVEFTTMVGFYSDIRGTEVVTANFSLMLGVQWY